MPSINLLKIYINDIIRVKEHFYGNGNDRLTQEDLMFKAYIMKYM